MQIHIFRGAVLNTILVLVPAIFTSLALAGGGNVLPGTAKPKGYSLSDMAKVTAGFNTPNPITGIRTYPYPDTPFQILYVPQGPQPYVFEVSPGTMLYVPIVFSDDTQPAIGSFPKDVNNRDVVLNYFYSRDQLGTDYTQIVVDGEVNSLGPDYVVGVGPVKLGDAYDDPQTHIHVPAGTQYIVSACFLTPLTKGSHTVQIRGSLTGIAVKNYQFDGMLQFPDGLIFEITFTVVVR